MVNYSAGWCRQGAVNVEEEERKQQQEKSAAFRGTGAPT